MGLAVSLAFPPRLRTLSWPARHLGRRLDARVAHVVRSRQPATRKADKIYQQGQSLSLVTSWDVNIDNAHRRIPQHIALEGFALDVTRLTEPMGPGNLHMRPTPGSY